MKTVATIIRKEFARFFKDIRLMLTAIFLPGILIFCVYTLMGSILEKVEKDETEAAPAVCIVNLPRSQQALTSVFELKEDYTEEQAKAEIKNGGLDLLVIFPQGFDELVAEYVPTSGVPAPNVQVYYNSAQTRSAIAFQTVSAVLSSYEDTIANKFDINRPTVGEDGSAGADFDLADKESASRMMMKTVVPMVLLMLLFSGCMAVAPESIAGEKERGTIATLLVTPVKRSSVAIGKIVALSVMALLSGLSSTIGMMLSLPKLAGGALSFSFIGFVDIVEILAVILSTVLVMVTLISIISAYAKSVKEASGLVVPLMILTMLCGLMSMFAGTASAIGLSFIPLFNSALAISAVLSGGLSAAAVAITVCVNLAFSALLVFVLTLMFKSEKIMFNK